MLIIISTNQRRARGVQLQDLRESESSNQVLYHERKMPKKETSDWVQRQNFRTPKTLKIRPAQHITRTAEANKKRRARLELSEENLETSGEDDVTFSQDRENEPSPPHRRSFTGDISLDSNQNNRDEVIKTILPLRNLQLSYILLI